MGWSGLWSVSRELMKLKSPCPVSFCFFGNVLLVVVLNAAKPHTV